MQKTTENYQDIFLNQARRERTMHPHKHNNA